MPETTRWNARIAGVALAAGASGLATVLFTPSDSLVRAGFDRALDRVVAVPAVASGPSTAGAMTTGPVSGSEQFWLDEGGRLAAPLHRVSRAVSAEAVRHGLSLGARMTVSDGPGTQRTYEAVEIRPLDAGAVGSPPAELSGPLLLVTWREVDKPTDAASLRMIVPGTRATSGGSVLPQPL